MQNFFPSQGRDENDVRNVRGMIDLRNNSEVLGYVRSLGATASILLLYIAAI